MRTCRSWSRVAAGGIVLVDLAASRVEGADSALGTLFGFGAVAEWKFLGLALAFPLFALIVILIVRWRERRRTSVAPLEIQTPGKNP